MIGVQSRRRSGCVMVDLLSCLATLSDDAQLSSYRSGREVRILKYDQALHALRENVDKFEETPKECAFHLLRIGGASTLTGGGNLSERVIQRAGR